MKKALCCVLLLGVLVMSIKCFCICPGGGGGPGGDCGCDPALPDTLQVNIQGGGAAEQCACVTGEGPTATYPLPSIGTLEWQTAEFTECTDVTWQIRMWCDGATNDVGDYWMEVKCDGVIKAADVPVWQPGTTSTCSPVYIVFANSIHLAGWVDVPLCCDDGDTEAHVQIWVTTP